MNLRTELERISTIPSIDKHTDEIKRLSRELGIEIQLVPLGPRQPSTSNCIIFALKLYSERFIRATRKTPIECLGVAFFNWLIKESHLDSCTPENAGAGALVVYFNGPAFSHVGTLLDDGLIESKWGTGLAYRHSVLHVPESYGDTVKYYLPLSEERAVELAIEYVRDHRDD